MLNEAVNIKNGINWKNQKQKAVSSVLGYGTFTRSRESFAD